MACSGCAKKQQTPTVYKTVSNYNFSADTDFILVLNKTSSTRVIKTRAMSPIEFRNKYGTEGYGPRVSNSQFYMLREDFDLYQGHTTIKLEQVVETQPEPEPEPEPEVQAPEPEQYSDVPEDERHYELRKVKGIGLVTARNLKEKGYETLEQLSKITEAEWKAINNTKSTADYESMLESVNELLS